MFHVMMVTSDTVGKSETGTSEGEESESVTVGSHGGVFYVFLCLFICFCLCFCFLSEMCKTVNSCPGTHLIQEHLYVYVFRHWRR